MKKVSKKILSLVLVIALALAAFPYAPITARADYVEMQTGLPATITIGTASATPTIIGFGGSRWAVIGHNGNGVASAANEVTLLSVSNTAWKSFVVYPKSNPSNHYIDSDLKITMDAHAAALDPREQAVINPRDFEGGATYQDNSDKVAGAAVTGAMLWPLSVPEANQVHVSLRDIDSNWWLRSPGFDTNPDPYASVVNTSGSVNEWGQEVSYQQGVRPAFKLDLSSILFRSPVTGSRSAASAIVRSSLMTVLPTTGVVKFTMADDTSLRLDGVSLSSLNVAQSDSVHVSYTAAGTEAANRYVSCVIEDSANEIKYYGKLAQAAAGGGTATIDIPADIPIGTYTLKLFNQECRGDNLTDFASTPKAFTLTVNAPDNPTAYSNGVRLGKDDFIYFGITTAPIPWRAMAGAWNQLTLMSNSSVESRRYDASTTNTGHKDWSGSAMCAYLNDTSGSGFFGKSFLTGEQNAISTYGTTEQANPLLGTTSLIDISQKIVLPSIDEVMDGGTWSLNGDNARSLGYAWWLRSQGNSTATVAYVDMLGLLTSIGIIANTYSNIGVRPVFKLNLSSVIFASEVVASGGDGMGTIDADANYKIMGGKSYKLTVLGGNSGADVGTLSGVPTATQYTTDPSLSLTGLSADQTGADYTVNYKIVAAGAPSTIAGYGFTAASNTSLSIDTSSLTPGASYNVYVWLQKNNALHSNESTMPAHFTLTMIPSSSAKFVSVGTQSGTLAAGTAGTVTFPVTTANISDGSYTATVANLPADVTVQGQVTINNNTGTLTLAGDAATIAGTTNNLILTIDTTASPAFTLTVIHAMPTASIDYANERLTGLTPGEYAFNSGTPVTVTGTTYDIDAAWFGATLGIAKTEAGIPGAEQSLAIPPRPAAPTVENAVLVITELLSGNFTGLIATMEYKGSGGTVWSPCEQMDPTDLLAGLMTGTFQIRLKATQSAFASEAAEITAMMSVPGSPLTVSVPPFSPLTVGYPQQNPQNITITNNSGKSVDVISVIVTDSSFIIGGSGVTTVADGDSTSAWTARPADALQQGSYNGVVFAICADSPSASSSKATAVFAMTSLTVNAADSTAPTVTVAPSGTGIAINTTDLVLTFDEAIDVSTAGTVTMAPDNITGGSAAYASTAGNWNAGNTVLTIPISGLAYNTPYTIGISGFQDVAGNTMTAITGHTFTTAAAPDTTAPTFTAAPSGTGVELGGNVVLTFSEAMNLTAGLLSLDGGATTLSGNWSAGNTVYTAAYSGLAYNTQYTIMIEGFEDTAGNAINPNPDVSHTFTTKAQPAGPDVSPTTLNLDLYNNRTSSLTISLGQSGNQAAQADITVDPANAGDISVGTSSLNADGTVTVTGNNVVSGAGIAVEFSGGTATPTIIPVTVNVADNTPSAHSVTLNQATGGTATASHATALAGEIISLDITSLDSGYSFVRWDVSPAAIWIWRTGGAVSPSAAFTMLDEDVEVAPAYMYYDPATGIGTYSGGGSRSSGGDYSDSPYQPLPPLVRTDPPVWAHMTLDGEPDGNGVLSRVITEDMVRQALEQALGNAESEGRENANLALEFMFSATGDINSLIITFSAEALALLESEGVSRVTIASNAFRFSFDLAAIKEMRAQSGGWAVTFSAARASNPSEDTALAIGGRPAWNVKLGYAYGGKTALIINLGAGEITLGMPYTLASGEKAAGLAMSRIFGKYREEALKDSNFASGWLNGGWSGPGIYGANYTAPAPALADQ